MSTPAIDLCNQGLRLLGSGEIASFDEASDLAGTCAQLYPDSIAAMLASHPWRFTMRKARLARLSAPPLNEWRYAHALPPNRLALRQITTSDLVGAPVLLHYELFDDRVFSNQIDLWCDYQVDVDPGAWPPAVRNLARTILAADFAVAVTGSASLADYWRGVAYGPPGMGGNGGLTATARRLDSQQQPPQAITDFPLIAARLGGA